MIELHRIVHAARVYLELHWPAWHARWGPPPPACASQWTCVRSSLFIQKSLAHANISAVIVSGVPTSRDRCGFFDGLTWNSHAWVRTNQTIVDVTADQFAAAAVIITAISDGRYQEGIGTEARLPVGTSPIRAVDAIWPTWVEVMRGI
ncbi:hypothetical protein [Methylobacterium sp. CM6246]